MPWALKRQIFVLLIILTVIGGGVFSYVYPRVTVAPTCFDLEMNGDEDGVDCGGSCVNFCTNQITNPTILWVRPFAVTDSVHTAMAMIENRNSAGQISLPYEFRLYDARGVFVARAQGTAIIPPSGRYAIVETGIQTGKATVVSAQIEFGKTTTPWKRIDPNIEALRVSTANIAMEADGPIPRLFVTLGNNSPTVTLRNIATAAVLYDVNGNAIAGSKTFTSSLAPLETRDVVFTWPRPISVPVVRYEIIPIVDVFSTKL
jgi:hypothetical protein